MLITAFEPFGGDTSNITDDILQALSQDALAEERNITFLPLPVSRSEALPTLIAAIEANEPDTIVCLGQANDRSEITVEKIAVNLCCYRIPDNKGEQPDDEPVSVDGPTAYCTTSTKTHRQCVPGLFMCPDREQSSRRITWVK